MSVAFARPDVSDLVFRLYARSIHPELLATHARFEIAQPFFRAQLTICDAGHAIRLEWSGHVLTEITARFDHPLPQRRQLIERRLKGQRDSSLACESDLQYHNSFQVERLNPDVYLNLHEELSHDCSRVPLSYRFPAGNRLSPEPLSLIQTEVSQRTLLIHTFHTFPENSAIVKTQSLFEIE